MEAFHKGADKDTDRQLVEELKTKLAVSGLARNPLLVTLVCAAYRPDLHAEPLVLPLRRVELYERILQGLLGKWRGKLPIKQTTAATA